MYVFEKKKRFDSLRSLKPEFNIYWLSVRMASYIEHTNYAKYQKVIATSDIYFFLPTYKFKYILVLHTNKLLPMLWSVPILKIFKENLVDA